jgi:adenine deaminase
MVVINRYDKDVPPAFAFIKNLGLQRGAFASSVAHDSHNIVAVGVTDEALCEVVNAVIEARGGLAVFGDGDCDVLRLPIAGLMSDADGYDVGRRYAELTRRINALGCRFASPLMTLSFMALLVIPDLKLSDKGLFNGRSFDLVELFADN